MSMSRLLGIKLFFFAHAGVIDRLSEADLFRLRILYGKSNYSLASVVFLFLTRYANLEFSLLMSIYSLLVFSLVHNYHPQQPITLLLLLAKSIDNIENFHVFYVPVIFSIYGMKITHSGFFKK